MFNRLLTVSLAVFVLGLSGCASKKSGGDSGAAGEAGRFGTGASETGGIGLGTLERVFFEFDQSQLDTEARDTLQRNADVIMDNPRMRVLVEGHCDERGSNEYNIALGERRSDAVIDYLANLGVQRSRLEKKSWGEERPLDPGKSADAYRVNRRAEFIILRK